MKSLRTDNNTNKYDGYREEEMYGKCKMSNEIYTQKIISNN